MPPLSWVLHPSNVCSHRVCCSTQQMEQLEGQRAAGQQELLRAREALSRAQLEAEVARGEQAALGEALAQVSDKALVSSPGTVASPCPISILPGNIQVPRSHVHPSWGHPHPLTPCTSPSPIVHPQTPRTSPSPVVHPQTPCSSPGPVVHPQAPWASPSLTLHPQTLCSSPSSTVHPQALWTSPSPPPKPIRIPSPTYITLGTHQAQGSGAELEAALRDARTQEARLRDAAARSSELAASLARDKRELSRALVGLEEQHEADSEARRELEGLKAELGRLERSCRDGEAEKMELERARRAAERSCEGLRAELRELRGELQRMREQLGQVWGWGQLGKVGRVQGGCME